MWKMYEILVLTKKVLLNPAMLNHLYIMYGHFYTIMTE
jgi:hypothetical protein